MAAATVATCASPGDDDELAGELAPPAVDYVHDAAGRLRAVTETEARSA